MKSVRIMNGIKAVKFNDGYGVNDTFFIGRGINGYQLVDGTDEVSMVSEIIKTIFNESDDLRIQFILKNGDELNLQRVSYVDFYSNSDGRVIYRYEIPNKETDTKIFTKVKSILDLYIFNNHNINVQFKSDNIIDYKEVKDNKDPQTSLNPDSISPIIDNKVNPGIDEVININDDTAIHQFIESYISKGSNPTNIGILLSNHIRKYYYRHHNKNLLNNCINKFLLDNNFILSPNGLNIKNMCLQKKHGSRKFIQVNTLVKYMYKGLPYIVGIYNGKPIILDIIIVDKYISDSINKNDNHIHKDIINVYNKFKFDFLVFSHKKFKINNFNVSIKDHNTHSIKQNVLQNNTNDEKSLVNINKILSMVIKATKDSNRNRITIGLFGSYERVKFNEYASVIKETILGFSEFSENDIDIDIIPTFIRRTKTTMIYGNHISEVNEVADMFIRIDTENHRDDSIRGAALRSLISESTPILSVNIGLIRHLCKFNIVI